jgi:hypothetical protein
MMSEEVNTLLVDRQASPQGGFCETKHQQKADSMYTGQAWAYTCLTA